MTVEELEMYLVVVGLTVGQALPLVVAVSKERLLALELVGFRRLSRSVL